MDRVLVLLIVLSGCSKVVKQEGFRAAIGSVDPKLEGSFESVGGPSCGRSQLEQREVHLVADRFALDVIDQPLTGKVPKVELVLDGERFVRDRPGGTAAVAFSAPGGRVIGSLSATLIHESAGTLIEGKPAPIREVTLDLTFNLQPCP